MHKPAWHWCAHCKPGHKACRIYEIRPYACKTYKCLWLRSEDEFGKAWPDELRPDRCKVIFEIGEGGDKISAIVDPDRPQAPRENPHVAAMIKFLLDRGIKVTLMRK